MDWNVLYIFIWHLYRYSRMLRFMVVCTLFSLTISFILASEKKTSEQIFNRRAKVNSNTLAVPVRQRCFSSVLECFYATLTVWLRSSAILHSTILSSVRFFCSLALSFDQKKLYGLWLTWRRNDIWQVATAQTGTCPVVFLRSPRLTSSYIIIIVIIKWINLLTNKLT